MVFSKSEESLDIYLNKTIGRYALLRAEEEVKLFRIINGYLVDTTAILLETKLAQDRAREVERSIEKKETALDMVFYLENGDGVTWQK